MALTLSEQRQTYRVFTADFGRGPVRTVVTASSSVVKRWIRTTLHTYRRYLNRLVVGLGVEWSPTGGSSTAATLQLCIGRRCLIFQLAHCDAVPDSLRSFLKNRNNIFVGIWSGTDDMKLKLSSHGVELRNPPVDLRLWRIARDGRWAAIETSEIVEALAGYAAAGGSDWETVELRHGQVLVAAFDAYSAFSIGKNIRVWEFLSGTRTL